MAGTCGYSQQPVIIEVQDREDVSGPFDCAPSSTMESSQFLLKWNNHQPTVVSVLDYLLNQEAFVDVTLACEGQSFLAHKVVLSACSTYFQDLLMKNPCKHPIIFLKDVRSRDVASLLQFMYRGEINVQQDDLPLFLKTAESLQIKGLADSSMRSPPLDDGEMDSSPIAPASRRGPLDSLEPTDPDAADQKHQHRAAERFGNGLGSTRSLLASALGHLVRNSSTSAPPDASPSPSFPVTTAAAMEYDHAGPSALSTATPPPAGLFSLPVTSSPGAATSASREDPRCTPEPPEWLSQTSHPPHHRRSESPPRSHHENGADSRDFTEHSEKVEPIDIQEILPGLPPETDPSQFYSTSMLDNQRFYECNICGKLFNSRRRDRFLAHLRLHTGERPFKCSICGRGFNRQDHVTVHMRLHTGGKPFQCSKCYHRFAKMVQLKSHNCQMDSASGNVGSSDAGSDLATPQSRPQNSRRSSNKR